MKNLLELVEAMRGVAALGLVEPGVVEFQATAGTQSRLGEDNDLGQKIASQVLQDAALTFLYESGVSRLEAKRAELANEAARLLPLAVAEVTKLLAREGVKVG